MTSAAQKLDALLVAAAREFGGGEKVAREFTRPMELAGLKSRIERARSLERAIGETGRRYDRVLDAIEEKHGQAAAHAGQLERYDAELAAVIEGMIGGSNDPTGAASSADDGQSQAGE